MTKMDTANLLTRLSQIPVRIADIVAGQDPAALQVHRGDGVWSAVELLAHLRASDDILSYRLYALLVRREPLLPGLDERRWAEVAGYALLDFSASLQLFAARRAELVAALQRLSQPEWERTGIHDMTGKFTLHQVVQHLVEHEEEHCQQLAALFNLPT